MNTFINFLSKLVCVFFLIILGITVLFLIILAIDFKANYKPDFSYNGCLLFDGKIDIIKSYAAATISVATLLIIIEQRRLERKNLDNQKIMQLCYQLQKKILDIFPNKSDKMRDYILSNHISIISHIYNLNSSHTIENRKQLKVVLDKYIIDQIESFENYYCKVKYSIKLFYFDDVIESHSFDAFKQISLFLLQPSLGYQKQFATDVESLYKEAIDRISAKNEKIEAFKRRRFLINSKVCHTLES